MIFVVRGAVRFLFPSKNDHKRHAHHHRRKRGRRLSFDLSIKSINQRLQVANPGPKTEGQKKRKDV